eukprot:20089-Heterococcus_DN1.PRE.4
MKCIPTTAISTAAVPINIQTSVQVLTSMPSASATTRMSLNRIAASMLYLRTGWRVTSATSAGS